MRTSPFKIVALLISCLGLSLSAQAGWEQKPCEMETQKCVEAMIEKLSGRGWVGIEMDKAEEGYWILTNVVPRSPAGAAGLQKGDEIMALNGFSFVSKSEELKKAHAGMKPGKDIVYTVRRNGQERPVTITLGKLPKALLAQWVGYHMIEGHAGAAADRLSAGDK